VILQRTVVRVAVARVFSVEFGVGVAERILNAESVSALSTELKIKRSVLYRWRDCYREQVRGRKPTVKVVGIQLKLLQ
jgi:transposase-like protein